MEVATQALIEKYVRPSRRVRTITCSVCGNTFTRRADSKTTNTVCRSCQCKARNQPGSDHPAWKGGHRYYQQGRHCADPNGLHWRTQKPLSVKRDNNTCQSCYSYLLYESPVTHHIIPYEFSSSHALSNLVTVCFDCHESIHRFIASSRICPFGPWLATFSSSWDDQPPAPYMGSCPF